MKYSQLETQWAWFYISMLPKVKCHLVKWKTMYDLEYVLTHFYHKMYHHVWDTTAVESYVTLIWPLEVNWQVIHVCYFLYLFLINFGHNMLGLWNIITWQFCQEIIPWQFCDLDLTLKCHPRSKIDHDVIWTIIYDFVYRNIGDSMHRFWDISPNRFFKKTPNYTIVTLQLTFNITQQNSNMRTALTSFHRSYMIQ